MRRPHARRQDHCRPLLFARLRCWPCTSALAARVRTHVRGCSLAQVRERYPLSGSPVECKRRDLRRGGRLHTRAHTTHTHARTHACIKVQAHAYERACSPAAAAAGTHLGHMEVHDREGSVALHVKWREPFGGHGHDVFRCAACGSPRAQCTEMGHPGLLAATSDWWQPVTAALLMG